MCNHCIQDARPFKKVYSFYCSGSEDRFKIVTKIGLPKLNVPRNTKLHKEYLREEQGGLWFKHELLNFMRVQNTRGSKFRFAEKSFHCVTEGSSHQVNGFCL